MANTTYYRILQTIKIQFYLSLQQVYIDIIESIL
jgi:hypothetical protein